MKFHYYEETDSLYIDFSEGVSEDSREVSPGVVADYDSKGNLVGLDIDHASNLTNLSRFLVEGFTPEVRPEPA
jgi:uncharacterized protein YuzE